MPPGTRGTVLQSLTFSIKGWMPGAGADTCIHIFEVARNVYAVFHTENAIFKDIVLSTINVSDDGATIALIDKQTLTTNWVGTHPDACRLENTNVFCLVYRQTTLVTIVIADDGTIGTVRTAAFAVGDIFIPHICSIKSGWGVASTCIALAYLRALDTDFHIKTYPVAADGTIGAMIDEEILIQAAALTPWTFRYIRDNIYGLIYVSDAVGTPTYLTTYTISPTGAISAPLASYDLDVGLGESNEANEILGSICNIDGMCLMAYSGPLTQGRFATLQVNAAGVVTGVLSQINCIHGAADSWQILDLNPGGVYHITYREKLNDWGIVEIVNVDPFTGAITHKDYVEVHRNSVYNVSADVTRDGYLVIPYLYGWFDIVDTMVAPTGPSPPVFMPAVETLAATGPSDTWKTLNGMLTDDGGIPCQCGYEWGLTAAYGNTTATLMRTTGQGFPMAIAGLTPGITYYYRAFATNPRGTVYGAGMSFTSSSSPASTEVATLPATSITENSAVANLMVVSDGGTPGNVRFEWGATKDYGQRTGWVSGFASLDTHFERLAPLAMDTSYHYRAVFTNPSGIFYGKDVTFSTLVDEALPVIIDDAGLLRLLEVK